MNDNEYIEVLRSRYNTIRGELEVLNKQHASIMQQMVAKQEVAQHLSELLAAEGHQVDEVRVLGTNQSRPVDLAFEWFDHQDGHSPIHYKELASILMSQGAVIAGKDPAVNLLAQINRDNRFLRVGPGKYVLAKWKIRPRASSRSRRKKRRR